MKTFPTNQKGMTLLEILLYVSISGAIIFAASSLLSVVYDIKLKGDIIQAVEEEGTSISYTLDRYVQNARQIFTPDLYKTDEKMILTVSGVEHDTVVTVFKENKILYSAVDNSEKMAMSSNNVKIEELSFTHAGESGRDYIGYSFVISGADATGKIVYRKSFSSGATVR
ncbi:MAG: hypothetical protein RL641_689 [Candidatus Parcubacteria bacterium]|jgi:type II secretory pathway pseudopilin PulG